MTDDGRSKARIWLWRLSLLIAALLIAASFVYGALAISLVLFLDDVADYLGRPDAILWGNIVALLSLTLIVGIALPIAFVRWAWSRAFPRRASGVET